MRYGRLAAAVALAALPVPARASGFFLYEQSAPALAKGSAMVASGRDPSAAWFNPAVLAFVPAAGASFNTALLVPQTRFSPRQISSAHLADVEAPGDRQLVPSLFGHFPIGQHFTVSLAVLAPFALRVSWPQGWVGAQESLSSQIVVVSANPSVAYRLDDRLSLAVGVDFMRGSVDLALALPTPPGGVGALGGTAFGVGANLGLLWRALPDKLHLGLAYRSRVAMPFRGRASFVTTSPGFEGTLPNQGVSADVTLPDVMALGLMWRPHPQLEVSLEANWVLWRTFDELVIDFEKPNDPPDRIIQRGGIDPLTGRLGLEWTFLDPRLVVRTGVAFDQSSSRADRTSASAPDGHRVGLGAGLGWAFGPVTVDVAYFYAYFLPTVASGPDAHPEGTYRSSAHVFALTLGVGGGGPQLRSP
jgi:long-chain fatty acid transport protein